jgi:hypothetical protein
MILTKNEIDILLPLISNAIPINDYHNIMLREIETKLIKEREELDIHSEGK